jgi:hypothetical protein
MAMKERETLEIFLAVTGDNLIYVFKRKIDKMKGHTRRRLERPLGPGEGERKLKDMLSNYPWHECSDGQQLTRVDLINIIGYVADSPSG